MRMRRSEFERFGGLVEIFDPPPPPPTEFDHAPCVIRLFPPGSNAPVQEWDFQNGRSSRQVEFAPHLPQRGSAAFQRGWWRCTLTVTGDDPASVSLESSSVIGYAPFQTRTLPKGLMDRTLGVVLDLPPIVVPQVMRHW